jgi:TonB-dependent receptor
MLEYLPRPAPWRCAALAAVLLGGGIPVAAQEPAPADPAPGVAAVATGKETRTEKVELLKDGSVAESLARKIDVGFGSVRIDGEKSNVSLSSLTADQVVAAETTKVPTPDLDADAVGGLLQLTSRRTFEQPKPTLRASVGFDYNALTESLYPEVSVTYGRAVGKKFGFVLTADLDGGEGRGEGVDQDWDRLGGRSLLEEVVLRTNYNRSNEFGFNGLIDWKLGGKSAAQFRASSSSDRDRGANRNIAYRFEDHTLPATSTSEVERLLVTHANEELRHSMAGSFSHKEDAWELEARLSFNRRIDETPDNRRYRFTQPGVGLDYAVSDPRFPRVTARPGARPDDPAAFTLDEFQRSRRYRTEDDSVASVDFKLRKVPRWPRAWIKAGAKLRALATDREESTEVYNAPTVRLSEVLGSWSSPEHVGRYRLEVFPEGRPLEELFARQPARFALDVDATRSDSDPANYDVRQDVLATYVMAGMPLGKRTRVLAGARMERTENRFTGYEVVTGTTGRYEATNRLGARSAYTNWFPGAHLNFAATSKLSLFASWTQSIRRPDYGQLVPARRIDRSSLEIYEGNPGLRPTLYTNYDVALEYVYHDSGRAALEGFHRDIDNTRLGRHVRLVGGPFDGYERSRPENGGSARQTGFELKWKQGLAPAGSLFKDFTFEANYTFTDSEQQLENRPNESLPLIYEPRSLLTLQLAYERKGFFGSLKVNQRSTQLDTAGTEPAEDIFRTANTVWDLSLSYEFRRQWRAFADVENITEAPWQIYKGTRSRVEDYWPEPRRFKVGLKWEM